MADVQIAVPKSPRWIRVTDSEALMEHAKLLRFRSQNHDLTDQELWPAQQRVEAAKLKVREAELAAEHVKLALDAIMLQERKALERFMALVRASNPKVKALAERYGGEVAFNFDSDGRSVWVVAEFGKGAPPMLRTVSNAEVPWSPLDDQQEEGDGGEEEES